MIFNIRLTLGWISELSHRAQYLIRCHWKLQRPSIKSRNRRILEWCLKKRKLVTLNRNSIIKTWNKGNQEELVEDLEADQSLLKKEKVFLQIKLSLLILDNKFMKLNLKNILQIKSEKYSKKKRQHQSKLRKSLIDLLKFRDLPLRELNLETKIRANIQENSINQICFLKIMKKD